MTEQEGEAMSEQQRKNIGGEVKAVGERQVRVIASTATVDREGDVVVPEGIDLTEYLKNPVVLRQHNHNHPVAECADVAVRNGRLEALVQFPPEGTSGMADETYRLVKSGVLSAVSIGFLPGEWEFMEPGIGGWRGRKYLSCELIEFSFVAVPANPDALVIERSLLGAEEQIALARRNVAAMQVQAAFAPAADAEQAAEPDMQAQKKAGRVLSKANADKLRSARALIGEVLEAAADDAVDDDEGEGEDEDAGEQDAAKAAARKRVVAAKLKAAGIAA